MDMNTLNPGQDFDELPESYVIFITRDDALGYGLPIYHIAVSYTHLDVYKRQLHNSANTLHYTYV